MRCSVVIGPCSWPHASKHYRIVGWRRMLPRRRRSVRSSTSIAFNSRNGSLLGSSASGSTSAVTGCASGASRAGPGGRHGGLIEPADSPELQPDEQVEARDIAARIRAALATLPASQGAAATLFYLAGLTHRETAAALGIEPGAVKNRLHKARGNLRRELYQLW
ncbi:MAG: sigma-70 family RNA polymerase sigma factor, partial [Chloroflexi bacterium]|nr:sigma-70 family RNA polymerase sigma factor [Chloroflexota bacterium]